MMGFVERYRKIRRRARSCPCRDCHACLTIHHRNLFGIGKVYKDAQPRRFQLKGFRVGIKPNITNVVAGFSVDNFEAAAAVADVDAPSDCIVSNVVGVIGKFYALDALKGRPSRMSQAPLFPFAT
jgi:hypothetical protein